ncbi:MAG: DUF4160 domain-containing protein [Deltaproteobacteria bacterium]|nr:DUF4160 domain-containing protein [Deltaproteobacteria bacterium]
MYYDEHNPPHIHVEYQGSKALIDFQGNILKGVLKSRTAGNSSGIGLDLRNDEINGDWELSRKGEEIKKLSPLE